LTGYTNASENRLQENVRLSNYTTARAGGPVTALLFAHSSQELADMCSSLLWDLDVPFKIIGSGSNVLVSDEGLDMVMIVINRPGRSRSMFTPIRLQFGQNRAQTWAESPGKQHCAG
jgi:UDP-N-acetylenolpyruvoylglucosamine reductase